MEPSSPVSAEKAALERRLEDVMQELHSIKQKLALKEQMETFLQDELEEVKKMTKTSTEMTAKKDHQTEYKKQIEELQHDVDERDVCIEQLEQRVNQLERALEQQVSQAVAMSFCHDSHVDQPSFSEEILTLNEENTRLKESLSDMQKELDRMKCDKSSLERRFAENEEMIEDMRCELTSYSNSLEKARMENMERNMALEEIKLETSKPASKGNSLYAELDDRRVASEKHLKSFQEKYLQEKKTNQSLKMQITLMEPRSSHDDSSENHSLRLQIIRSNSEITTLIKKMENYEKSEAAQRDKVSEILNSADSEGEKKKAFGDFLLAMLKTKEKELLKLKAELRNESMMYWDQNSRLLEKEREIFFWEKKEKKLQSQIVQLNFKLNELLTKYEPEKVPAPGTIFQGKREKIQLDVSYDETENEPEIRESHGNMGFSDTSIQRLVGFKVNSEKTMKLANVGGVEEIHEELDTSDIENVLEKPDTNELVTKCRSKRGVFHVPLSDAENVLEKPDTDELVTKGRSKRGVFHVPNKIRETADDSAECKIQ